MKHGDKFSATIKGVDVVGKISMYKNIGYDKLEKIYLCQNSIQGANCLEKFEYEFSYVIGTKDNFFENLHKESVTNFKLLNNRKQKINSLYES